MLSAGNHWIRDSDNEMRQQSMGRLDSGSGNYDWTPVLSEKTRTVILVKVKYWVVLQSVLFC